MDFLLPAVPLQATGDVVSTVIDFLPVIIAMVVLIAAMMWGLAWFSRYIQYLKTMESTWLDEPTLEFVHRVLEGVWIALVAFVVIALAATKSESIHDGLAAFVVRVPAVFFFVFVLFAAAVIVRVFHRFAAYLRGELKAKPKRVAPANALAFAEIVLKYVIYVSALVIAILGGIRTLPAADQTSIDRAVGGLPPFEPTVLLEILVGIVLILIADRFVDSIFEDLKRHTKKFSQPVVDEFKAIARYGVWILGAIVILFIFMDLALSEPGLIVFAAAFIAFLVILAVLGFETTRNLLAGIALMRSDPFDAGDRVKIGEDIVADVISIGLTLTKVRTLRGETVQIPNARLLQTPILNFNRSKPYAVFVEVAVGFGVGHERVRDLLVEAATQTEGIVSDRAPEVFGKDVDGGRIVYQLYAYTDQPEHMKEIKSALIYRIQDLFTGAGLIP